MATLAQPQPSDFEYLGAFALTGDHDDEPNPFSYGQRGLALDPADGNLWITGHDWKAQVFKVEVPVPVKSKVWEELPTAPIVVPPQAFMASCPSDGEWHFGAIEVLNDRLDGICNYWYNVSGSDLETYHRGSIAGSATEGPFHVGKRKPLYHSSMVGAYLFTIPEDWAQAVGLGSKRAVTGFSREAGAFGGSQGPTMIAFDPDNPSDARNLLWYREKYPNCPPNGCDYPEYTSCDAWEGATWVAAESGPAILLGGSKGLGETRYGLGNPDDCDDSQGYHCDPLEIQIIFYDADEIAATLQGKGKPWDIEPYAVWHPSELWSGACGGLGGMAYDKDRRLLLVVERQVGPDGKAVMHAYRLQDAPTQPESPDP